MEFHNLHVAIEKLSKELNNILHLLNETSTSDIILETILSNISQVVRQSEGNQVDQTETNLDIISTILSNITNEIFTDPSLITENVSNSKCLKIKISHKIFLGCCKHDTNSEFTSSMDTICF